MHAIRRLLPVSLIALTSAFGQAPTDPQPLPPGVPAGVPAAAPAPAPAPTPVPVPAPAIKPVVPPVPGAAAPNAVAPAAAAANVPLAERKITAKVEQPKMNGTDLAFQYREWTGRRVIVSAAAAAAEFAFNLDASPADPLTYAKAADYLKMAALLEGFVFVPAEEGVDKLMFSAASSGPKQEGISIFNDNDILPQEDRVVTYVMGLKYLKPDEAVRVFTTIIGQFGSYGSIAAIANTSAVIITEKTSLIRKLLELKTEIDKPGTEVATRFIKVQFADPTELAQTLNELLNTQAQAQRTAGVQRTDGSPAPIPAGGGANAALAAANAAASGGEENPPQIVPDPRTNRIFAMGRPIDLVFIEGLVREFDTQSEQKNFLRRKLRYIAVSSFLETAENALNRAFTSGTGGASGGTTGGGAGSTGANFGGGNRSGTTGTTTGNRSGTTSNRGSSSSSSGSSSSFGSSGSSGSGGGGAGGDALSDPNTNTAPESRLVGRTLLVADNVTNSLVVQGTPASIEVIEKLLDQIDVKAEQVMIATVFGQLSLNDDLSYGAQFLRSVDPASLNKGGSQWVGGRTASSTTPLVDIPSLLSPSKFPTPGGLNVYGMISDQFNIYLQALQSTGHFTVLSRPSIFTNNNQRGVISSGQRIAVPTNSFNGGVNNGGQSTNIEYRDVVLKLEVIPLVNSEREITLQIALINDDVVDTQEVVGVGKVPVIGTRELLTTVTVPNNSTVVLGGLITTSVEDKVSGIPLLSSIPGIGKLFSTTTKTNDRSELVIFIQPSIVGSQSSLDSVQRDTGDRYKLSGDVLNFSNPPPPIAPPDSIVPATENAADYRATGPVKSVNGNGVVEAPASKKPAPKRIGRPSR
jgi:general secretion pathway protein D